MMWYFNSPEIMYGEGALSYLDELQGKRAFIVTDPGVHQLGFTDLVTEHLRTAGIEVGFFAEVEPEPSLVTVARGAKAIQEFAPDWIVGLGGGSAMDAAKAMWIMYERPEFQPGQTDFSGRLGLGAKARLLTIPTTAGTGAEVTIAAVITDTVEGRKLEIPSRELMATLVIVDPALTANLPPHITADTGLDVLTHAVDAYLSSWHNEFTDGLCLKAAEMVFKYLPRAFVDGRAGEAHDAEAREKMANAATIAGLGISNAHIALTHAIGHSLGVVFHWPHGRCVAMALPYFIEYEANGGANRVADLAYFLRLPATDEASAGKALANAVRDLMRSVDEPVSVAELGVDAAEYEACLEHLCDLALGDTAIVTSARMPDIDDLAKIYRYIYEGRPIDF
jgi:alcohol dehydrogenase class IV